jgi:hypothetical protein
MNPEQSVPVTRTVHGILWQGREVGLSDFPEIREYVDSCIFPDKAAPKWVEVLTLDFVLLKELLEEAGRAFPTERVFDRSGMLSSIPPPPPKPAPPHELSVFRMLRSQLRNALLQLQIHERYLADFKKYQTQRKEWGIANKAHRKLARSDISHSPMPRDLPGKPVPPLSVSKYGDFSDKMKDELNRYVRGRRNLASQLWQWRKAMRIYRLNLPKMEERHAKYKQALEYYEYCKLHEPKQSFLNRLMKDIDRAINDSGLVFKNLRWQILPPGEIQKESVSRYLQAAKKQYPNRVFDSERLEKVMELKPSKAYVGQDEFDGYVVFLFPNCDHAVLECPWVGNALYLLKGNWVALSRLPKGTLLDQHQRHARRIIHDENGSWFQLLKREISANSRSSSNQ